MIIETAIAIYFACSVPVIENNSTVPFSKSDAELYDRLIDKCQKVGKCITLFEKHRQNEDRSFHFNVRCRIKRWPTKEEEKRNFYQLAPLTQIHSEP